MIRTALRTPGFARLFAGLSASMCGDSLMLIVLSLWVKTLTGSNGAAGLTFLAMTSPALVAPLLGWIVDRVPRRGFLVVANVASALAMLPLLWVHDAGDVWIVYVVAFCYGVSFVVVPAALNGLLKDLLPTDALVDVNAALSITREVLRLGGPLLGASLFALGGGGLVAILDAATFLVAAVAIGSLRLQEGVGRLGGRPEPGHRPEPEAPELEAPESEAPESEAPGARWVTELAAGARFIRATPPLLHSTVALAIALLMIGFSESAIYAVVDAYHREPTFVGVLLSLQGAGAIAAGLVSGRAIRRWGEPASIVAGLVVLAAGLAGVALATGLPALFVASALVGAGIPVVVIAFTTLLQTRTPGHLMGRVSTFVDLLTTMPQALSIAVGALLVTLLDYRVIFATMALGMLVAAGYPVVALRGRLRPTPSPAPPGTVAGALLPEPAAAALPPTPTRPPGVASAIAGPDGDAGADDEPPAGVG